MIKDVFGFLLRCYKDYHLFHYVGFLTHSLLNKHKLDLSSLYLKYKAGDILSLEKHVFNELKKVFAEIDLDTLNYVRDQAAIRDVLLYFNIYITMENPRHSRRFPFHTHFENTVLVEGGEKKATWQLEHINPRSINQLISANSGLSPKVVAKAYLGSESDDFEEIKGEIQKQENDPEARFNGLYNLCLLDSVTNNAYKDAPFLSKRNIIIQSIAETTYVPLATEQVFLRAFWPQSGELLNSNIWSFEDQACYEQKLKKCFAFEKIEARD